MSVFVLQHKNYDTSCGVILNLEQPAQEDSVVVEVLRRQGAIPFVKTNVPQGLLKYIISQSVCGHCCHMLYSIVCTHLLATKLNVTFACAKSVMFFAYVRFSVIASSPVMTAVTQSMGRP